MDTQVASVNDNLDNHWEATTTPTSNTTNTTNASPTTQSDKVKAYYENIGFIVSLKNFINRHPRVTAFYIPILVLSNIIGFIMLYVDALAYSTMTSNVYISGMVLYTFSILLLLFQRSGVFSYLLPNDGEDAPILWKVSINACPFFYYAYAVVMVINLHVLNDDSDPRMTKLFWLMTLVTACNSVVILRQFIFSRYTHRHNPNYANVQKVGSKIEQFVEDRGGAYRIDIHACYILLHGLLHNALADSIYVLDNGETYMPFVAAITTLISMAVVCYVAIIVLVSVNNFLVKPNTVDDDEYHESSPRSQFAFAVMLIATLYYTFSFIFRAIRLASVEVSEFQRIYDIITMSVVVLIYVVASIFAFIYINGGCCVCISCYHCYEWNNEATSVPV